MECLKNKKELDLIKTLTLENYIHNQINLKK